MRNTSFLAIICMSLLVLLSDCRRRSDVGPRVLGSWTVSVSAAIGTETIPAPGDYAAINNQTAEFTGSATNGNYRIGNFQGTFTFTFNNNNTGGTIQLSPDIQTGGEPSYTVSFNGNQMIWTRRVSDPNKSFNTIVTLTFTKQ